MDHVYRLSHRQRKPYYLTEKHEITVGYRF